MVDWRWVVFVDLGANVVCALWWRRPPSADFGQLLQVKDPVFLVIVAFLKYMPHADVKQGTSLPLESPPVLSF